MRLPPLACLAALVGAFALVAGCVHTVYVVENPDGTYTEVDAPASDPHAVDPGDEVVTVELASSNDYVLVDGDGAVYVVVDVHGHDHRRHVRPAIDVALVVDRSGSMEGAKLASAKAAAHSLVDDLEDGDRVALLSYASDVTIDHGLVTLDPTSRRRLAAAIDRLAAAGGTAIGDALEAGASALVRGRRARGLARVWLVSDGRPTVGETNPWALEAVAGRVGEVAGVSVTTFGVGTDYNEDLMVALAVAGRGNYYYVEDAASIAGAFGRELRSFGGAVADDLEVTLDLGPGVGVREVYGYRHERRGEQLVVPMSAIGAGERRRVLVALEVPPGRRGDVTVAHGRVAFRRVEDGAAREVALPPVRVGLTADRGLVAANARRPVMEKVEAVRSAEARRMIVDHLDRGDVDAARGIASRRLEEARRAHGVLGGAALEREVDSFEALSREVARPPAPASSERYQRMRKSVKAEAYDALMF